MTQIDWWRSSIWWREEAWRYVGIAFSIAFLVIVGRAIWLDYPLDSGEVREWVGALSGWVAAAAAVITINYVSRQTRAAERAVAAEAEERRDREARSAEAVLGWVRGVAALIDGGHTPRMFAGMFPKTYPSVPPQAIENVRLPETDKATLRDLHTAITYCNSRPLDPNNPREQMQSETEVERRIPFAQAVAERLRDRQFI